MLQAAGIKVPDSKKSQPAVHQCSNPNCNYMNIYESEICEKCSTPLTPLAFDKRKRVDEDKMRKMIGTETQELVALRDFMEDVDTRMSQEFEAKTRVRDKDSSYARLYR